MSSHLYISAGQKIVHILSGHEVIQISVSFFFFFCLFLVPSYVLLRPSRRGHPPPSLGRRASRTPRSSTAARRRSRLGSEPHPLERRLPGGILLVAEAIRADASRLGQLGGDALHDHGQREDRQRFAELALAEALDPCPCHRDAAAIASVRSAAGPPPSRTTSVSCASSATLGPWKNSSLREPLGGGVGRLADLQRALLRGPGVWPCADQLDGPLRPVDQRAGGSRTAAT